MDNVYVYGRTLRTLIAHSCLAATSLTNSFVWKKPKSSCPDWTGASGVDGMTSSYVIVPQGWQREVAVGQEYVYYIRSVIVRRGQEGKLHVVEV